MPRQNRSPGCGAASAPLVQDDDLLRLRSLRAPGQYEMDPAEFQGCSGSMDSARCPDLSPRSLYSSVPSVVSDAHPCRLVQCQLDRSFGTGLEKLRGIPYRG